MIRFFDRTTSERENTGPCFTAATNTKRTDAETLEENCLGVYLYLSCSKGPAASRRALNSPHFGLQSAGYHGLTGFACFLQLEEVAPMFRGRGECNDLCQGDGAVDAGLVTSRGGRVGCELSGVR